jgi:hypothetical protein
MLKNLVNNVVYQREHIFGENLLFLIKRNMCKLDH